MNSCNTPEIYSPARRRVLIFQIQCPEAARPVFFLFPLRQVIHILRESPVCKVPFAPPHIEGIALWQGDVLPVICLETCMGMAPARDINRRMMVVRSGKKGLASIIRVGSPIRMMVLPRETVPVHPVSWLPDSSPVRGIYEGRGGFLVVADMERILTF